MDLAPLLPAFLPGPDFVDRAWGASERSPAWLRSFQALFDAGRLAGTGHLCLLAGRGEPEAMAALAQEGGCSGLVAPERTLGAVARRYAHRVPLIAWVSAEREPGVQARRIRDMGAVGVCVTLDGPVLRNDAHTTAFAAAATAEGLFVLSHVLRFYRSEEPRVVAAGAGYGAALAWRDDWPRYSGFDEDEDGGYVAGLVAQGRAIVREAWGGRVGQLAAIGLDADARTASTLAKRAGAMGTLVHAASSGALGQDIAALHAIQDVWADGSITLA